VRYTVCATVSSGPYVAGYRAPRQRGRGGRKTGGGRPLTAPVPRLERGGHGCAGGFGAWLRCPQGRAGQAAPADRRRHRLEVRLPLLRGGLRAARVHEEGRERQGRAAADRG